MPDIELRNVDGQLVAIDESTGAQVAIPIEAVSADELNGADISTSAVADRVLETDGNGNLEAVAALTDGDDVKRELWVIASGAGDPVGSDANDLIFVEES